MRRSTSSMSLLRFLSSNSGGRVSSFVCIAAAEEGQQHWHIFSSRSFASDADKGSSSSSTVSPDDEVQDKKGELGRWWQTFSEQSRAQAENMRKTNKESRSNRSSVPNEDQALGQKQQNSFDKADGANRWFIPKGNKLPQQERQESLNKETISRWFQPKDTQSSSTEQEGQEISNKQTNSKWYQPKDVENSSSEQERQEITSKQVGARWLASSQEKSSSEQELSDLSRVPWFGFSKETPESERERLEASMQRLALMSKLGDNNEVPSFMFLPPKDRLLRKYFHWDNLSSPEKHKITLTKVRQDFQLHKTDCGSSEVQIAQLTSKIKYMTKHMETHRKDYHSRKGLEAMVQQRRKILKYLRRKDWDSYCDVISKLGLRDNVMEPQKR